MKYSSDYRCQQLINKYSGILNCMAEEMSVDCGLTEHWHDWIRRILYSSVAPIALASLYDLNDDNEPVSITHFKRRIRLQFECYQDMYKPLLDGIDLDYLMEYVFEIFIHTGHMYHLNKHLKPVVRTDAYCGGIKFMRGQAPGERVCRSGLGAYTINHSTDNDFDSVRRMFHLPDTSLENFWRQLVCNAKFRPLNDIADKVDDVSLDAYEYLQRERSHVGRYWKDHPDDGVISVARTKTNGDRTYYLYQITDGVIQFSQIESWKVNDGQDMRINCACLNYYNRLPALRYDDDNSVVRLHLDYLLPPEELWLYKLYSWPFNIKQACDFTLQDDKKLSDFDDRIMASAVFKALKPVYEHLGFTFMKGIQK